MQYFKWKLEVVSNVLSMVAEISKFMCSCNRLFTAVWDCMYPSKLFYGCVLLSTTLLNLLITFFVLILLYWCVMKFFKNCRKYNISLILVLQKIWYNQLFVENQENMIFTSAFTKMLFFMQYHACANISRKTKARTQMWNFPNYHWWIKLCE